MRKTGRFLARFWRDTDGASAAEYAILLAVIGTVMAVAASQLGESIATAISDTTVCLKTNGGTCN